MASMLETEADTRVIRLDYLQPALQLGLAATPRLDVDTDTCADSPSQRAALTLIVVLACALHFQPAQALDVDSARVDRGELREVGAPVPGACDVEFQPFRRDACTKASFSESGGSAETLAWSAPDGIADGRDLIVTSGIHTFTEPEKLIYLGFGGGWLYSQSDGTAFADHSVTTISGTEHFVGESNPLPARTVVTVDGRKYLHTRFVSTDNPNLVGAGMINWDTGSNLLPGDRPYMYRVSRMSVGSGATNFQWKAERIGAFANLPAGAANHPSAYLKHFSQTGPVVTTYSGSGASSEFYFEESMNKLGIYAMQGWQWKQNTPDVADGGMITHGSRLSDNNTYKLEIPARSGPTYPDNLITSATTNRPRYMKVQDYVGNLVNSQDIDLWTTDYFWQLNGSLFVIADHASLDAAQRWTPVVPTHVTGNTWTLRLWRGMLPDYRGAHLFLLDADLNVVASVALEQDALFANGFEP